MFATMRTYGITEARKRLSALVEGAARGEAFVIAKAGRPLVKVVAVEATPQRKTKRLGFLAGEIVVPADFDEMGASEIATTFGSGS